MDRTVLAAIDLSNPEHHTLILQNAQRMANLDDARLAVISVIPDFGMSIVGTYFEEGAERKALSDAADTLHRVVTNVLGSQADAEIKHIICQGSVYQEVLKTAKMLDATLIVMGAHRPNFQDYLLGPNTARVVRHSACSVLVLRE